MQNILQRGACYLTDCGLETALAQDGRCDLRSNAAFALVDTNVGRQRLITYYRQHADLAAASWMGFVFATPTRKAHAGHSDALGYDDKELAELNRAAVQILRDVEAEYLPGMPTLVAGIVGPRGVAMTADEAAGFHAAQVEALREADIITAASMGSAAEAAGIVLAARHAGKPVAVSFATDRDGQLASGQSLREAIAEVDHATGAYAAYFMLCGSIAQPVVETLRGVFARRIKGVSAACPEGDPDRFGANAAELTGRMPWLQVFGGCCGTDIRHARAMVRAVATVPVPA